MIDRNTQFLQGVQNIDLEYSLVCFRNHALFLRKEVTRWAIRQPLISSKVGNLSKCENHLSSSDLSKHKKEKITEE
jgi:hypothetical protein